MVKKGKAKKKKLQKYQAPIPTKDTAMPIQSDSDADDDSPSGETKLEKIQKLLEPYTKYQRINFLVGAVVPNAFLFTCFRDAADRDISRRKLVVYGLVWVTTRETLVSAFESYGEIEDCKVIFDRVMGKTKGYSFVQFKTRREAAKALKQPRKMIRNLMSRMADLVTSKEGTLPMIGAPFASDLKNLGQQKYEKAGNLVESHLEDKVSFMGGSNDRTLVSHMYQQRNRREEARGRIGYWERGKVTKTVEG
ncbi:UBP1-associated proteins 1A-like [Diospyros lotus]|uniref:UBP1-associated proteins 1A-like n=1 Tax=Diospyros lotus TaxID=55363 RepID=UPI00225C3563|nr:UBP1-associated proteins 1A-like [Diospyros lotus]